MFFTGDTLRSPMQSLIVLEAGWGLTVGCGDLVEFEPYRFSIYNPDAMGQLKNFLNHLGYQVEPTPVKILNPGKEPVDWLLDNDADDGDTNGFRLSLER